MYVYISLYIYIHIERDIERERDTIILYNMCIYKCAYVYTHIQKYIYIYIYIYIMLTTCTRRADAQAKTCVPEAFKFTADTLELNVRMPRTHRVLHGTTQDEHGRRQRHGARSG